MFVILIMENSDLLILGVGVSQHKTDGVLRFEHFCNIFNLQYRILGNGKTWYGGDTTVDVGGGQKINEVLEAIKNMDNKLIIICDTFDLFPIAGKKEILEKFNKSCDLDNVLFSSEVYCWPDEKLIDYYPNINTKYKYLNSGCIMGYRDNIYDLIKNGNVKDNDDDQLFFTLKMLQGKNILLDHKCELFQTLNGSDNDIIIHKNRLYNKYTDSYPVFIHGNGPSKLFLNRIENYIESNPFDTYSYTMTTNNNLEKQPKIFFALYVDYSKWIELNNFMNNVANIKYGNKVVYIYDKTYNDEVYKLTELAGYSYKPNTVGYNFEDFKISNCEYYFLLEQRCIITKVDILHEFLPRFNNYHRIISPLLNCKSNHLYSNFWGALDNNGYYSRSNDYLDLLYRNKRGLWNVPYITGVVLISKDIIINWDIMANNKYSNDTDMQLCFNLRKNALFMYMANFNHYGYIGE